MTDILFLVGFILLVKGADYFVSGSSAIAEYLHIPTFIIGLTIVACGTSLPEAAISVTAALKGANGIVAGNAIGSNMLNLLVVLGASALIRPCSITGSALRFEYPLSILAAALLLFLSVGSEGSGPMFSRIDGVVLFVVFVLFLTATVRNAMKERKASAEKDDSYGETGAAAEPLLPKNIVISILGAAAIIIGGDLVVDAATEIAASFGIDETLIGLTVVALGTSLPELVTSTVAAFKGETDIAVGNVIGSNLFNLLFVLGLSITIHPVRAAMFTVYDLMALIIASLIVLIPLAGNRTLTRGWGIVMLAMYGIYLVYIIMRTV